MVGAVLTVGWEVLLHDTGNLYYFCRYCPLSFLNCQINNTHPLSFLGLLLLFQALEDLIHYYSCLNMDIGTLLVDICFKKLSQQNFEVK